MIHHNAVYGQLFVMGIGHDAINHIHGVIKINNANTINDVGAYFNTPFLSPRNLPYFTTKSELYPTPKTPNPNQLIDVATPEHHKNQYPAVNDLACVGRDGAYPALVCTP